MNNDNFLIELDCLQASQQECSEISDAGIRSRAVANVFASKITMNYFQDNSVDTSSGIHNVKEVLSDIDIADIYVDGNLIDVRVYFNNDELCVPKSHFDYNILPLAYMFIKLDSEFSSGEVMGFVFPESIDTGKPQNGYYTVNEDMFVSYYDVNSRFVSEDDKGYDEDFKKNVFDFVDGKLKEKGKFYQTLLVSSSARELLQNVSKTKSVFESLDYISLVENNSTKSEEQSIETSDDDIMDSGELVNLDLDGSSDMLEPLDASDDLLAENDSDGDLEIGDSSDTMLEEPEDSLDNSSLEEFEPLNSNTSELNENLENESDVSIGEYEPINLVQEADDSLSSVNTVVEEINDAEEQSFIIEQGEDEETTFDNENSEVVQAETPEIAEISDDESDDDIKKLSEFDYSTEIMPSMNTIENTQEVEDTSVEITEEILDNSDSIAVQKEAEEMAIAASNQNEQINTLFNDKTPNVIKTTKKKSPLIPLLGLIILLSAAGYYGYTKYTESTPAMNMPTESLESIENSDISPQAKPQQDAMPIETVENVDTTKPTEDATSVSIPAIEQNLNSSIQVSNLNINWEVPTSYANNATAKRYFLKVGKVLQLNLKAELLMLSKSPITNKITVELEFYQNTNKFGIKRMVNSSGVNIVDNVIKDTVNRVLEMNMNMNMSVFKNLSGNPVLVINL